MLPPLHGLKSYFLMQFLHSIFCGFSHPPGCSCVQRKHLLSGFSTRTCLVSSVSLPAHNVLDMRITYNSLTINASSSPAASNRSRDMKFLPIPPAMISVSAGGTALSVNAWRSISYIYSRISWLATLENFHVTSPFLLKPKAQLGSSPA